MKKIVGIASQPHREVGLIDTLKSISPQVDIIHVWLNNYNHIPNIPLKNVVFHNNNNSGALGKLRILDYITDDEFYFFMVDDDILYPTDYIQKNIEHYTPHTIQSSHAKIFPTLPTPSFNRGDISGYYFASNILSKNKVHVVGTGVSMMDSTVAKSIPYNQFIEYPNMLDIWVSAWAYINDIDMYVIPHYNNWLVPNNKINQSTSIWETTKDTEDLFRTSVYNHYINLKKGISK